MYYKISMLIEQIPIYTIDRYEDTQLCLSLQLGTYPIVNFRSYSSCIIGVSSVQIMVITLSESAVERDSLNFNQSDIKLTGDIPSYLNHWFVYR